jgi:hypothetical protein
MADQHPNQGRRQHFHRGRRGHDRRGERRPSQAPQGQPAGGTDAPPEQIDVDQIVRDIKARISQRHGIDLSAQQIQELAARRLEAILDPRTVKPGLLDQLRKAAGAPADIAPAEPADAYTFEDHTIYDTHNALLRFFRKLFNPLLKLLFNPNPIAAALHAQAEVNRAASRREAERERTQAEWNALHYTMLQRLVTEVSRVSLEMQSLALRVESLATRTDFTERRIRGLESVPAPAAVPSRSFDAPSAAASSVAARPGGESGTADASPEGRRRRRRRRGRRGPGAGGDAMTGAGPALSPSQSEGAEGDDDSFEDGPENETSEGFEGSDTSVASDSVAAEPAAAEMAPAPEPPPAPAADAPSPDSSVTSPVTDPSGT